MACFSVTTKSYLIMSKCLNHYSYEYVRMHFHQMTADDEEMEEKEEEQKQMSLKQYVMAIN
jgi:hypothetical protein